MYALCIILGIAIAITLTGRRLAARGADRGAALDFGVWAVVFGLIFARAYHVVTHWSDYFGPGKDPLSALMIWQGGIAIFGALLGGGIGVYIASRINGIRFLSLADALVPGLLLAQAVGRLGNYFNHELFGGPTTLPWGLEIESTNLAFPVGLPEGTLFHPTFLYEILWNVLGVVVLLCIERKIQPRWGTFFAMYLVWYGAGRFVIEGMRLDPSFVFFGLRINQLTALLVVLVGLVLFVVQRRRHRGREENIFLPGRFSSAEKKHAAILVSEDRYHVEYSEENEASGTVVCSAAEEVETRVGEAGEETAEAAPGETDTAAEEISTDAPAEAEASAVASASEEADAAAAGDTIEEAPAAQKPATSENEPATPAAGSSPTNTRENE